MATIELSGNKGKLIGEKDHRILESLDLELSFRLAGYEYSPAFRACRWDGRTRLMNSKLEFPIGLTNRVIEFYSSRNLQLSISDLNEHCQISSLSIENRLSELDKVPRYYQVEAAEAAIKNKRGVIKICTGGGKTLVAALITAHVNKNTVIYVIGKDLLWQFHGIFTDLFQREIGIVGDGECKLADITIASVWTVGQAFGASKSKGADDESISEKSVSEEHYRDIRNMVRSAKLSILDECHLGAADTIQQIGTEIRSEYTIGMSASPYRDDNANLLIEAIFGKVIVNIPASDLISKGFLVKPVIKFIPVPKMTLLPKDYRKVYKQYITQNDIRNEFIVNGGIKLVEQNFVTMVLFKEIEHGKILFEKFKDRNVYCHMLNGKMSSDVRKSVVQEVTNGKCKLLLASSIFDIGIDIPSLSGLILAGGGKSSIRSIQRIGRAIRPYEGKQIAAILDFNDNAKYLRDHSKARRAIYDSEPGFEVHWYD